MEFKKIPISCLKPATYNPRINLKKGDVEYEKIRRSIEEFDLVEPLVWNKHTGNLIGGHQRLKILIARGDKEVEVSVVKIKDKRREKALNISLNKVQGGWDFPKLKELLIELDDGDFDLGLTGFDETELKNLMDSNGKEGLTDPDEVPDLPKKAITKLGDIWKLGKHRLLCGDATKQGDINRLMDGKKTNLIITDPPYGIGYEYNTHEDIKGKEYLAWCDKWWPIIRSLSDNIIITTGWSYNSFWWDKKPFDCLYWVCKNKQSGGRSSHFRKVEPIFIFGNVIEKYDVDYFEILNQYNTEMKGLHTCPKPVELMLELIKPQTKEGDIVVDVFQGSGTTLITCNGINRICYSLEIDPIYCDVIVERWENFTGGKANRAHN